MRQVPLILRFLHRLLHGLEVAGVISQARFYHVFCVRQHCLLVLRLHCLADIDAPSFAGWQVLNAAKAALVVRRGQRQARVSHGFLDVGAQEVGVEPQLVGQILEEHVLRAIGGVLHAVSGVSDALGLRASLRWKDVFVGVQYLPLGCKWRPRLLLFSWHHWKVLRQNRHVQRRLRIAVAHARYKLPRKLVLSGLFADQICADVNRPAV